jgi:NTE family protein
MSEGRQGIALCLSGGGFRASLFHLGAMRRLHELGILGKVDRVSSVSGGSIAAALLADRIVALGRDGARFEDFERDVAIPMRAFTSRDLRTWPILAHLAWNWIWPGPRVRHLEARYRRRLTSLLLRDLPPRPEFVLCATSLAFGVNWEFRKDGAGDYQTGTHAAAADWPLARAVAASSSFPPVFGPVPIATRGAKYEGGKYRGRDRDRLLARLALSDGGVYDNMGLEPVWKDALYVLVSDCGAPFEFRVGREPIGRLLRYTSVVTNQALALRKRAFFADLRAGTYRGTYWSIATAEEEDAYSPALVADVISNVRTDLDAFTRAEACVLENHGYLVTERKTARWIPELGDPAAPPPRAPHPEWLDEGRVREALRDSHKRFSLRRMFASG